MNIKISELGADDDDQQSYSKTMNNGEVTPNNKLT
jgi:hypothetical protein